MNESDRRQRVISSTPRLTIDEVATRSFAKGVRGYSETEVRAFLKRVAEELAVARGQEQSLEAAIDELEEQVRAPRPLSEQELLDALGEETARLLRSAREASDDIRKKAEERAARLVDEASDFGGTHAGRGRRSALGAYRGSRCEVGGTDRRGRGARGRDRRVGDDGGRGDPRQRAPATPRDARRGEGGARARARRSRPPAFAPQRADRGVARRTRSSARRVSHGEAHVPRRDRSTRAGRGARRRRARRRRTASRSTSRRRSRRRSKSSTACVPSTASKERVAKRRPFGKTTWSTAPTPTRRGRGRTRPTGSQRRRHRPGDRSRDARWPTSTPSSPACGPGTTMPGEARRRAGGRRLRVPPGLASAAGMADQAGQGRRSALGGLLKRAKRRAQDDQNALLDSVRRHKGRPTSEQVLTPADVALDDWMKVLRDAVDRAYGAGRVAAGRGQRAGERRSRG